MAHPVLVVLAATVVTLVPISALTPAPGGAQELPPEEAPAPNVLLIVTDDQRTGTLDVMPKTRRIFGAGGTTYYPGYASTPLCCPARATLMTGQHAHNHRVVNNNPGSSQVNLDQETTLQRYLNDAGYRTGLFGKYFNSWDLEENPPHFDRWTICKNGYYDTKFNVQGDIRVIDRYSTDYLADKASSFIRTSAAADEPWFVYLAPNAPHVPFTPARKYADARVPSWKGNPAVAEADRSDKPPFLRANDDWKLADAKEQRRLQLRTLMSVDDMVGKVFRTLDEVEQTRETLAIFVSDNGFFWSDHGLKDKRYPYTPSVQVPLLVRWPGQIPAGEVDHRMAAHIDIAPTVLDAAGIAPDHTVDGKSLLKTWTRTRVLLEYAKDYQLTHIPTWASTRTDAYQYVEYYREDGGVMYREYYDLLNDPWQLRNLLGDGDTLNDPNVAVLSLQLQLDRDCTGTGCP